MKDMTLAEAKTAVKQPYITYEEYLSLSGEPQITEWVDGEVIKYMPPFQRHQVVVSFLNRIFGEFISICYCQIQQAMARKK